MIKSKVDTYLKLCLELSDEEKEKASRISSILLDYPLTKAFELLDFCTAYICICSEINSSGSITEQVKPDPSIPAMDPSLTERIAALESKVQEHSAISNGDVLKVIETISKALSSAQINT